jgi:phenylacetate-CoA ligase
MGRIRCPRMRDVVGAVVLRAANGVRSSPSLRLLDEIRAEPFVTPEQARARQLERLRDLVRHCETHVPYYRRRFADAGFTADDLRSLDDLGRIPILSKADVVANAEDMIAGNVARESLLEHHSGGSTGVPLRFYRDAAYVAASDAGTYRNMLQCGWRPGEMIAFFWGWNDRLNAMSPLEFELRQFARRMYQFDPFRSGEDDMAGWWRTWRRIRPRVALGYASTLARFARFLRDRSLRPPPLRGVFTTAEKLFPVQRALLEDVFDCRVFDCYGSSEVQNIATECGRGRMHINADYAIVETDGEGGDAAADGSAPLLVTSLKNFAMPFLRYRNEDRGALEDGACDCGSGFPLMSLGVARVSDNFTLPNGRVVHGEFFTHLLYGSEGVDSFQFHQTAPGRIVLRYVPAATGDPRPALFAAASRIHELAPGMLDVEVEAVSGIPLSAAGKHRFTRSDVA